MYSISEVARCFDVPVSTLRYYDELGLLPAAGRKANVRYYGDADLRRLALIQRLHRLGMVSLTDTATLLTDTPAEDARDVLTATISTIKQRIEDLSLAQRLLEHLLSCPNPDPVRDCTYLRAELAEAVAEALAG